MNKSRSRQNTRSSRFNAKNRRSSGRSRRVKRRRRQRNRRITVMFVMAVFIIILSIVLIFSIHNDTKTAAVENEGTIDVASLSQEAKLAAEKREEAEKKSNEYLILVNKHNSVEDGYKPDDLTIPSYSLKNGNTNNKYVRKEAAEAFDRLAADAAADGVDIRLVSGFRSTDRQGVLYDQYVRGHGKTAADTFSARKCYSEHHTGLALDVSSDSVGYKLTESLGSTEDGKWLAENGHKYGYIIRYPKGKEDTTGYTYEPWHIRYVGIDAATEIFEKGVTLEEYLGEEAAPDYL